ncbi:MAG: glycosyl transferase group [Desulfovibrionaceae bacterium]|nr:MAG: glycosyl transferase group [Desulfovibrionaceae bacterium]
MSEPFPACDVAPIRPATEVLSGEWRTHAIQEAVGKVGSAAKPKRNVLLVNCLDSKGGASGIAVDLFRGFKAAGHEAWLAVSRKTLPDDHVLAIPDPPLLRRWEGFCHALADKAERLGVAADLARRVRRQLAHPVRSYHEDRGLEVFNHPGSRALLERLPMRPDVIHCHNLHHGFFDLNLLPAWSRRHPVVLTLHDAWLLGGHCVHSFQCERWKTGCGQCPDLGIYPPLKKDGTARNCERKKAIYARSRMYVTTPSRWLLDKVEASMLAAGMALTRVIPNGIDTGVFRMGDKMAARRRLGLPEDAFIPLFVAEDPRENLWKDYPTLKRAFARLSGRFSRNTVLLALGGSRPDNDLGGDVRILPFVSDPAQVAEYYRAADVYAHPARAETFPTVILEAMACGTPVVASAVGGIPEQVCDGETGFLVGLGDDAMFAERLAILEHDPSLAQAMGERAANVAATRFSRQRMHADYLDWFEEVIEDFKRSSVCR